MYFIYEISLNNCKKNGGFFIFNYVIDIRGNFRLLLKGRQRSTQSKPKLLADPYPTPSSPFVVKTEGSQQIREVEEVLPLKPTLCPHLKPPLFGICSTAFNIELFSIAPYIVTTLPILK